MTMRLTGLAMAAGLSVGLAGCNTPAARRTAMAENMAPGVVSDVVRTLENCPASDNGGFGGNVRHFGNATPWSENPFSNPCWPN